MLFFANMDGRGLRQMRVRNRCTGMSRLDEACKKIFPSVQERIIKVMWMRPSGPIVKTEETEYQ